MFAGANQNFIGDPNFAEADDNTIPNFLGDPIFAEADDNAVPPATNDDAAVVVVLAGALSEFYGE